MQNFISIPFKTESEHGLTQVNGIAKFSPAGIVLEFESKLFGIISNGVKDAQLPIGDVLDIKFRKGILKRGAKIEVRSRSLMAFKGIPTNDGKLTLKIKAEDFERARDAVARLEKDLADYVAQLPPPAISLFDPGEDETKKLNK